MRNYLIVLGILLLTLPALAQENTDKVFVRAAHFSADAAAIDVYVDEVVVWQNMAFAAVSDWLEIPAGSHQVTLTAAGSSPADAWFDLEIDPAGGDWLTLALTGYAGRDALDLQTITEEYDTIPRGETRISVLHAVPDLPGISVYADGIELARLLNYAGAEIDDGFVSVDLIAGRYMLQALDDVDAELVSSEDITFGAERAYLFALVGTASNPQYVLVSTNPATVIGGEQAEVVITGDDPLRVRVGHFAPGVPLVDLWLDGEPVLQGLSFGTVTEYSTLNAGTYAAALVPADGSLEEAIFTGTLALPENTLTLVAAVGYQVDGTLQLITAQEEALPPASGLTRIAFFQAIRTDALFDLLLNENRLIQGLAYPDAFAGAGDGYVSVDIAPGSYDLEIQNGEDSIIVGNVLTGAGRVYLVVALGTPDYPTYLLIPSALPE